jgi:hypothetical protein
MTTLASGSLKSGMVFDTNWPLPSWNFNKWLNKPFFLPQLPALFPVIISIPFATSQYFSLRETESSRHSFLALWNMDASSVSCSFLNSDNTPSCPA